MSGPVRCDLCQEQEALFLVTNTQNGDTTAACLGDFARMGLESAKAVLPPEEILTVLGIPFGPAAETAAEGNGKPKGRKSRKAKESEPEPEPETPAGLEEAPPAPENSGNQSL